jgi:uncharacterized membrane protein required for colicin V production
MKEPAARGSEAGGCVDVVEFIQGLNLFDLLVAFFVAAFFVVGYIQGAIRRALGLAILVVTFLLALNLREPLGSWLAQYWTHLPEQYVYMLAFGGSFLVLYLAASITAQTFYRRTTLFTKASAIDELVGGILGALQAIFLVGTMILILDSYFALTGIPADPDEIDILRSIYDFYDASQIVELYRTSLIPLFFTLFGWIVPDDLAGLYS